MYIQKNLVVSSILTLCMLTVSFLLSSLTVIQNNNSAQFAANDLNHNKESVLLVESLPQSCENNNTQQSETCLYVNSLSANNDTELSAATEVSESSWASVKTLSIMIPELERAMPVRESLVVTALEGTENQVNELFNHALESTNQLACEMITRDLLSEAGHNRSEENTTSSNSICIELYRDNGDSIANSDDDQFIGFSLVMGDSNHNPEDDQFSHLIPGMYFAKIYSTADSSAAASLNNQSIASDMSSESEN